MKNDPLGIGRIKARIKASTTDLANITDDVSRVRKRANQFASEFELILDTLNTSSKNLPDLVDLSLSARDRMSEAMIEVVNLMDAIAKINGIFSALTGHSMESSETWESILREITNLEGSTTEFRGNYSTLGTLVLSYLSEDMLLALVAADDEASKRALNFIGQDRIETWLDSQDQ